MAAFGAGAGSCRATEWEATEWRVTEWRGSSGSRWKTSDAPLIPGLGLLEMHPNGYGFLRSPDNNYSRERTDPFVPGTMIERYGLRQGVMVRGLVQHAPEAAGPAAAGDRRRGRVASRASTWTSRRLIR